MFQSSLSNMYTGRPSPISHYNQVFSCARALTGTDEQHHGRVRGLHGEAPAAGQRGAGEEPEGARRAQETAGGEGSGAGQVQTHCQEATGRGAPCEPSESPQRRQEVG